MSIQFAADTLDPRVRDAGILLNLLSKSGSDLVLNEAWFTDPFSTTNIGGVGTRGQELVDLAVDFVGDKSTTPPDDQDWYPITLGGKATGVNMVVGKSGDTITLSLGMVYTKALGSAPKITGTAFILLPMLAFDGTGWAFVLGDTDRPAKAVGELTTDASWTANGKTYQTLRVTGDFVLNLTDGGLPGFKVDLVDKSGGTVDAYDTLSALLASGYQGWIDAVLGVSGVDSFLRTKIGTSTETIGSVLVALKLLQDTTPFKVADLQAFVSQDPVDVAKAMLKEALDILTTQTTPLIKIGSDGGIWAVQTADGDATRYGVRVTATDLGKTVGAGAGSDKTEATVPASTPGAANKPQALLQIGKWFTGEPDAKASWLKRVNPDLPDDVEPGAYAYLLEIDASNDIALKPRIELISVGFDYVGGNDTPLIDVKGATLGGFEPRMYLALDIGSGGVSDVSWGAGLRMDRIALPLAGSFDSVTGDNAVASNLIASGEGEGGDAAKDKTAAVNPPFSVSASGMGDNLSVQLYGPDDAQTNRIWFPISRTFGPINCEKIGIDWQDKERFLSVLFDGGVSLGALAVELVALSVGFKITQPTDLSQYKLGLEGLGISFTSSTIQITGAFLQDKGVDPVSYSGQARIQAGPFGIGALGSYTTIPDTDQTSLFVFAFLDFPLGGPGFFFVTGLAAGFGYNRQLVMPEFDKVLDMPLVAAFSDPSMIGGKDATPMEALDKIKDYVPPTRGQYFLTAGLKFTTYEIVNSLALVAVQFGTKLEIDLMGVAAIKLPQVGPTFAYADLELMVVIAPEDGIFRASLALGPESFVLDPKCKLTGGFAFYSWFGPSDHAGDFVVTLGGYHPAFDPPDWYPAIPRVGFNWPAGAGLEISGGAYFALTPSCAMAGGNLNAVFQTGGLKAWFTAQADFIIYWKPFYFDATFSVSVGVSYTFDLFGAKVTMGVSLGCDFELWGPDPGVGGKVEIDWYIISFSIGFGPGKMTRVPLVDWDEFKTLLPGGVADPHAPKAPHAKTAAATAPAPAEPTVVSISVSKGLLTQIEEGGDQVWFVRPDEFVWFTKTTIPATQADIGGTVVTQSKAGTQARSDISVRPMGVKTLSDGSHTITLTGPDGMASFDYDLDLGQQPESLWGAPVAMESLQAGATLLADCIEGVAAIRAREHGALVGPPMIDAAAAFTFVPLQGDTHWLPLDPAYTPATSGGAVPSPDTLEAINQTLEADAATRTQVFDALASLGVDAGANGDLTHLAANPTAAFAASPMMGSVA